jgi:hypothetical protein
MDPSEIRFSQKGVSENFKDGRSILDLADELLSGKDSLSVEPIRLVERNGNLFSLDNRRLVAFQIAEFQCHSEWLLHARHDVRRASSILRSTV